MVTSSNTISTMIGSNYSLISNTESTFWQNPIAYSYDLEVNIQEDSQTLNSG